MPVGGFVSSDLSKIESNEVINDDRHSDAMHYTKRRLRDAIEAQEMLEKAFKDYTKGIDPVWVRTMSLLVGHENLQFRFVDSKTNPRKVDPDFVYDDAIHRDSAGQYLREAVAGHKRPYTVGLTT